MSEISLPEMLRRLSVDYYQNHIGFEEYRTLRKGILDKIDEEFNGRKASKASSADPDDTVRNMNTIAFYNNTDIES